MKKILFCICLFVNLFIFSEDTVKDPNDPTVKGDTEKKTVNLEYQKQDGFFYKGYIEQFTNFYLSGLVWEGNENANQNILIDFVESVRVNAYTTVKKQNKNLSIVFYFPYIFDIKLKNGTEIKNAKGRIKELESFEVYNEIGKEKCYTYFIRYWLEDKKIFSDNNSNDFNEKAKVPKEVVIFLDFSE
ncbi:MAG TPA: hypothetical protein PLO89_01470 [Spirochaetota bacterium]|nr:hypothetical protein [Spirochaetota bacterium]